MGGLLVYVPQTNRTRARLEADQHPPWFILFVLHQGSIDGLNTSPNKLHQPGRQSVCFNWTKQARCESALNVCYSHLLAFNRREDAQTHKPLTQCKPSQGEINHEKAWWMTERNHVKRNLPGKKEKSSHHVNNWVKAQWKFFFVSTSCKMEMGLIMDQTGAAADILLSRWRQNLNWGMVYSTSEERNK